MSNYSAKEQLENAIQLLKDGSKNITQQTSQMQKILIGKTVSSDDKITVYRGVKKQARNNINDGDYVTQKRAYAQDHVDTILSRRGEEGKVISKVVFADTLFADNPNEFYYISRKVQKSFFKDRT